MYEKEVAEERTNRFFAQICCFGGWTGKNVEKHGKMQFDVSLG